MDTAENRAMEASQTSDEKLDDYKYYNAKTLETVMKGQKPNDSDTLIVTKNANLFNIPVNTSVSAVHVPTNVYDRGKLTFI